MITGFYCPGCGGSRALMFLLKGDLFHSFIYHPALLYILGMCLLTIVRCIRGLLTHKRPEFLKPVSFYILIVIIFVQWIVKNVMLVMGCDYMTTSLGSFF
jgi:hypothetical protein